MDGSDARPRVVVEGVQPEIDCGGFALKRSRGGPGAGRGHAFAPRHPPPARVPPRPPGGPRGRPPPAAAPPARPSAGVSPRELSAVGARPGARLGAWSEMSPRPAAPASGPGAGPGDPEDEAGETRRHGTFADVAARLPYVAGMGFDVLYLPPIHPIGTSHRKGRNNSRVAAAGDPGSPWAIGAPEGGHTAIHAE